MKRAVSSRRALIDRKPFYPWEVLETRGDPIRFQQAYPQIMFVRIPLLTKVHWLFKTQQDLETFKAWVRQLQ